MAKRGLTPVVAIILMVVVAVAAALAFYAWFKAFQSQTQVKVSSASTATVEQTRAPLVVTKLNVTATSGASQGGVTIKNLGSSSQTISKFLYRDLSAGGTGLTAVSNLASVSISGSGTTYTSTATTWNCTSGDLYYLEIRTDKGSTSSDTIRCV